MGTKEQLEEVPKDHIETNRENEESQPNEPEPAISQAVSTPKESSCAEENMDKTKKKRDFSKHKNKKHKKYTENDMIKKDGISTDSEIETNSQGDKETGIDNSEKERINQQKLIVAGIDENSKIYSEGEGNAKTRNKEIIPPKEVETAGNDESMKEKLSDVETTTGNTSIEVHE